MSAQVRFNCEVEGCHSRKKKKNFSLLTLIEHLAYHLTDKNLTEIFEYKCLECKAFFTNKTFMYAHKLVHKQHKIVHMPCKDLDKPSNDPKLAEAYNLITNKYLRTKFSVVGVRDDPLNPPRTPVYHSPERRRSPGRSYEPRTPVLSAPKTPVYDDFSNNCANADIPRSVPSLMSLQGSEEDIMKRINDIKTTSTIAESLKPTTSTSQQPEDQFGHGTRSPARENRDSLRRNPPRFGGAGNDAHSSYDRSEEAPIQSLDDGDGPGPIRRSSSRLESSGRGSSKLSRFSGRGSVGPDSSQASSDLFEPNEEPGFVGNKDNFPDRSTERRSSNRPRFGEEGIDDPNRSCGSSGSFDSTGGISSDRPRSVGSSVRPEDSSETTGRRSYDRPRFGGEATKDPNRSRASNDYFEISGRASADRSRFGAGGNEEPGLSRGYSNRFEAPGSGSTDRPPFGGNDSDRSRASGNRSGGESSYRPRLLKDRLLGQAVLGQGAVEPRNSRLGAAADPFSGRGSDRGDFGDGHGHGYMTRSRSRSPANPSRGSADERRYYPQSRAPKS